jgi:hypothetical protein
MSSKFDEKAAQALIGKYVVVGVTYTGERDEFIDQKQFHGRVVRANAGEGVVIVQASGEEMKLPPFLRAFEPAKPGEYRLRSTGEVITDPDYTCTWSVKRPSRE